MKRSYSDEEKARLLAVVDVSPSISQAARDTGVPESTLNDWANGKKLSDRVRELREQSKNNLARAFEDIAWRCLGSMTEDKLDKARLSELSSTAGTAVDKRQLLEGKPTGINENRNANTDESFKSFFALLQTQGLSLDEQTARAQFEAMQAADGKRVM